MQHSKSTLQDVEEVTEDGAPSGEKEFIVWEPPLVDINDPSMGRRGALTEAVCLARFLMERGIRLIVFCTVRVVPNNIDLSLMALSRFVNPVNW